MKTVRNITANNVKHQNRNKNLEEELRKTTELNREYVDQYTKTRNKNKELQKELDRTTEEKQQANEKNYALTEEYDKTTEKKENPR